MENTFDILDRFVNGQTLTDGEFAALKRLFATREGGRTIEMWLAAKWETASDADAEIGYDALRRKIDDYEHARSLRRRIAGSALLCSYQRIAAVLLVPLLVVASLIAFGPFGEAKTYTAEAPWGEKARLVLPDGSVVLLNAGSRISYTSDFDRRDRRLELDGEAYFEVRKNKGKPFVVSTPYLDVRVTGTKFNVNAYDDEPSVVASLVEGSVNVTSRADGRVYRLTPGHSLALAKASGEVTYPQLNGDVVLAWKDNRLVFADDDIASLAKKIEKWYDVKVVYDPARFANSKFTVRLMEGERLDNLLDIIETALGAECSMRGDTLVITRRK